MDICIAQNLKELKFILKSGRVNKLTAIIPLNLETQLYCVSENLNYINILPYIDNEFHSSCLFGSEKLINNLEYGNLISSSQKRYLRNFIRKRFFSAILVIKVLNRIIEKKKINSIFISGWASKDDTIQDYFISELIQEFFNQKNIVSVDQKYSSTKKIKKFLNYELHNHKNFPKSVLLTSIGYNFHRIIFFLIKNKFKVYVPEIDNISFLKKIFFKILGIKFIKVKSHEIELKKDAVKIGKINFIYEGINYSNFLNKCLLNFNHNLTNLKNLSNSIDFYLNSHSFDYVISCITRGYHGYFLESAKKNKMKTLCIPHGTVSKSFYNSDFLYKKIIAEGVLEGEFSYIACQTKICTDSLKNYNVKGKNLNSGNLIFGEIKKKNLKNKNKILYAVTIKNFYGMQFLGVELDCEFLQNLEILSQITEKEKFKFLVHLHSSVNVNSKKMLKKVFPNLEFYQGKIENSLKRVFLTISFSSTAIEDSLCSKTPVILFDRWKRYKHCEAETDFLKKNQPIYYINTKEQLVLAINTIKNSQFNSFDKITFHGSYKENIINLFNSMNR